jgi:hypothetical protein
VEGPAIVSGAIQKGPFVIGSSITISAINQSGVPTGQVFNTQTTNDLGTFSVAFSYRGYTDIQAQGFYYDEITGGLSSSPIVLRALYDVTNSGPQTAYVNIVTHLAYDRALALLGSDAGMTLEAAEAQAERELVTALQIGGPGFNPGSALGITLNELGANSVQDAYLFAVGATLIEAATYYAPPGSSLDSQLQEMLDTIASQLGSTGTVSSTIQAQMLVAQQLVDVDLAKDLFAYRLYAIGSSGVPADMNLAIDSDGDGYRNSVDTCPLVANPNQSQIPAYSLCRLTRHTTFLPVNSGPTCQFLGDFAHTGHVGVFGCGMAGPSNAGSQSSAGLLDGDGNGRFVTNTQVLYSYPLVPVQAADINGDGNLDTVGGGGWAPGDGAGNFGSVVPWPQGNGGQTVFPTNIGNFHSPPILAIGDVNGDGRLDVAGGLQSQGIAVLLGTATPGSFASPVFSNPGPTGWCNKLVIGDLNKDGHEDLVCLGTHAYTWFGNGTATFQPGTASIQLGDWGSDSGDIDGDGNLDIIGWDQFGTVTIAFGDGTGAFPTAAAWSAGIGQVGVGVGDYNADGKTDLFVAGSGQASYSQCVPAGVALSKGRTFAPAQTLHLTPTNCHTSNYVNSQDINGDGTPDIVLASESAQGTWDLQTYLMNH